MRRRDFEELRRRYWTEDIGEFDSLVILPLKMRHDSGYRCMDFVAVKDGEAMCRLAGGSDVLHIEGVGGYGYDWLSRYNTCPSLVPPVGWSIDCLPTSGLLRMFCHRKIRVGDALSSFEIYSEEAKDA